MKQRESQPTFMEKIENKIENLRFEIAEELHVNKKGQKNGKK